MTILTTLNDELTAVVAQVQQSLVQLTHGRRGIGAGTIWHEDGLILTNAHVVQRRTPKATLWDGREYETTLLASDESLDIAALSIEASDLPIIPLGDSEALRPGQWVTSVGHPWGVKGAASFGNVIEMGTPLEWNGSNREMIQVGIQLRPGHSGGPMVDEYGRLVGINTLITGPQVGLAVPIHVVTKFLAETLNYTPIQHL
ncbi:MAG: trypsin-like peptidase domain-containing protein [Chloroflexota bacterium]